MTRLDMVAHWELFAPSSIPVHEQQNMNSLMCPSTESNSMGWELSSTSLPSSKKEKLLPSGSEPMCHQTVYKYRPWVHGAHSFSFWNGQQVNACKCTDAYPSTGIFGYQPNTVATHEKNKVLHSKLDNVHKQESNVLQCWPIWHVFIRKWNLRGKIFLLYWVPVCLMVSIHLKSFIKIWSFIK